MTVLIIGHEHDLHAHVVAFALRAAGVETVLWSTPEITIHQPAAIRIGDGEPQMHLRIGGDVIEAAGVTATWLRRPVFPSLHPRADPRDAAHLAKENGLFLQSTLWRLSHHGFQVNPYAARRRVKSKAQQLVEARRCGLAVPETLIANDPAAIRAFAHDARRAGREVIYKPFRVSAWREDGGEQLLHTALFDSEAFSDAQLVSGAGIYQHRIAKAYELRIHVMGARIVAVRLESAQVAGAETDWRSVDADALSCTLVALPAAQAAMIRAFMDGFGLMFGIIDAIVTPGGDFVFLEINEMGQFLWVDRLCPEAHLLEQFCAFLKQADPAYDGRVSAGAVSYAEVVADPAFRSEHAARLARHAAPDYTVEWVDALV